MIRHMRIHNTSDGGQLDVGVSDKSVIEFNGLRFPLASLVWLRELAEAGTMVKLESVGPMISFAPHKCPEPKTSFDERAEDDWQSASERAYKES